MLEHCPREQTAFPLSLTHTQIHTQVDGPHGAPAQDWSQFESAVLISAGLNHDLCDNLCRNYSPLSLRGVFVRRTHAACMHKTYQISGLACRYRSDAVRFYHQTCYSPHEAMQNLTRRGRYGLSRSHSLPAHWTPLTSSVRRRVLSLTLSVVVYFWAKLFLHTRTPNTHMHAHSHARTHTPTSSLARTHTHILRHARSLAPFLARMHAHAQAHPAQTHTLAAPTY
jgi:hypothetical protein